MSRILYIDATQGASGDMLLGALVDLGVPLDRLRRALDTLPLAFRLEARRIVRAGLAATKLDVLVDEPGPERGWHEIRETLEGAALDPRVRERALAVFRRLIEAEAEVHGTTPDEVHLHEAGGADALIDVVGAVVALAELEVERIVVSPMTTGFGELRCAHGVYSVPAPATALLVRGAPVRGGNVEAERLTPTGAALLTTLADAWGPLPPMRPTAVGLGAGSRDLGDVPNMLRVISGLADAPAPGEREVAVLECTLDDQTPQAVAHAASRLLGAGALEAFTGPVTMKKGRAGHHLTVLAKPEDASRLARDVLRHTSSFGVRMRVERRFELEREVVRVDTEYGPVPVKLGWFAGELLQAWPEYDDCAALAEARGVPLKEIQQAALRSFEGRRR